MNFANYINANVRVTFGRDLMETPIIDESENITRLKGTLTEAACLIDALNDEQVDLERELTAADGEIIDLKNTITEMEQPATCRRCGEAKMLNRGGWCSVGCELGFAPGTWWR